MPVLQKSVSEAGFYVKMIIVTLLLSGAILFVFVFGLEMYGVWHNEWSGYNSRVAVSDGVCNIAVVPLTGEITSLVGDSLNGYDLDNLFLASADAVVSDIRRSASDPNIRGVMMQIDSPGGGPVASEMITDALQKVELPTVALVRSVAASGAYLVATGADTIVASRFSDVGSIGVSMSYVQNANKNSLEGLEYVQLTSAEFKDSGTPERPLTETERALFERDLEIYHNVFVNEVATNRNLPLEQVQKLADGSSMPAELAWSSGLVDALGNEDTAREWFATELGMNADQVIFCQ